MYGEGATSGQAGVSATLFLRLRDGGGNLISDDNVYETYEMSAALLPGTIPATDFLSIPLAYSDADIAIVGHYVPEVKILRVLRIALLESDLKLCYGQRLMAKFEYAGCGIILFDASRKDRLSMSRVRGSNCCRSWRCTFCSCAPATHR